MIRERHAPGGVQFGTVHLGSRIGPAIDSEVADGEDTVSPTTDVVATEVALVGGDTTRGPLCVTVQLLGHVATGRALTRAGGRAGDALFVSGTPGDAAAGLALEQGRISAPAEAGPYLRERFLRPTPRMALGERLRGFASACIDVSDGLLADAGRLAGASHAGAELEWADVPLSAPLHEVLGEARARELAPQLLRPARRR